MLTKIELENWENAQEYPIRLDSAGKIIDFLDEDTRRENKPEERIRQRMLQVLHFEFGYPKNLLAVERWINIGRERKRVDIVVFATPAAQVANDQGQMVLIVETKAPNEKEPDGQHKSYLNATSAQGGFWTNGNSIRFYRKNVITGQIEDWIGIPKFGFAWDSVGKFKKSDLIQPIDLKIIFRRCHNALYRSGIDSEDIALDIVRIILAKVEDESRESQDCLFHITQEEFGAEQGREKASNRIRDLFQAVKTRFPDVFYPYEDITASNDHIAIVISYLQLYSLLEASYDVIGTAYEVYVASHLKGERGQYFTNRLVVSMMVEMLNPSDNDVVLDPACGSGGFLIATMNHVFRKIDASKRSLAAKELLKRNVSHNLFGVDTTPKLVKVAKTNMLLSKDGHTGIIRGNSLGRFDDLEMPTEFRKKADQGKPSIILTNPPFGAGHDLRIKEQGILANFLNGHIWNLDENNNIAYTEGLNVNQGIPPEILFLERCIQWVRPGGTIGIVMAKGQLDNREALATRKFVLDTCQVMAVVNLHEDTFQPFVGAKASVIFLRRKEEGDKNDYRIFMSISNKIGQTSRGEPIFKRDAEGNLLIKNNIFVLDQDLSEIAQSYKQFLSGELEESAYHFSISYAQINPQTLSLNPVQYLPAHNAALQHILSLADADDFELHRLGDLGRVYNGPRFKRPYADIGVKEGSTIHRYLTGTALTQLNSDNVKYLDSSKADKPTRKHLDALTIYKGYILVSDSGTLGRVTYALSHHNGHIATNNLIRVVIEDELLRGYVYQFLKSPVGQHLMLKNAYGTNQEHLEPDIIADIPIPIPKNRSIIDEIGKKVLTSLEKLEQSIQDGEEANNTFSSLIGFGQA